MMPAFVQASRQVPHISHDPLSRTRRLPQTALSQSSQTLQQGHNFASTTAFDGPAGVRSFSGAHYLQVLPDDSSSAAAGQSVVWNSPASCTATVTGEELEEEVYALPAHWIVVPDKHKGESESEASQVAVFSSLQSPNSMDITSPAAGRLSNGVHVKLERESSTAVTVARASNSTSCSTVLLPTSGTSVIMSVSQAQHQVNVGGEPLVEIASGVKQEEVDVAGYSKDLLRENSVNCEGIAQSPIQFPALAHILQAAQEMRSMQDDAELRNKGVSSIVTDLETVLQLPSPTSSRSSSPCNHNSSSQQLLIQTLDNCVTSSRSSSSKDQSSAAGSAADLGPAAAGSEHRRRDSCGSNATSFNLASLLHADRDIGQLASASTAGLCAQEGGLNACGVHNPRGSADPALVMEFGSLVGEHTCTKTNSSSTNGAGVSLTMNLDKSFHHDMSRPNLDLKQKKVPGIRSQTSQSNPTSVSSQGQNSLATYDDMRALRSEHKFQSPRDVNFQSIFSESPLPSLHHFDHTQSSAVTGFGSIPAAELHPPDVFSDAISCDSHYGTISHDAAMASARQSVQPFAQLWEDCEDHQPILVAASAPLSTVSAAYSGDHPWHAQAAHPHSNHHLALLDESADYPFHGQLGMAGAGGQMLHIPMPTDPIRPMSSCKAAEEVSPGVHLVNLVISCGDAIDSSNFAGANVILSELSTLVSPYGDAMQRVASYFTYGLVARMAGIGCGPGLYQALGCKEPTSEGVSHAFQCFHQVCPFTRFSGMAANQALLEALQGEDDIHVIDMSMTMAWQWIALLQDLKSRTPGQPPTRIRLTAVVFNEIHCTLWSPEAAQDAGEQIAKAAHALGLQFQFRLVLVEAACSLQPWQLVDPPHQDRPSTSAVAVCCTGLLHRLLHDDTGHALANVLAVVRNLNPKVVAVTEPDANHNCSHFLGRFLEALHYYSAVFDSLAAALDHDSRERAQIEQLWFGRQIINIVACEGSERVERYERLHHWRERLTKAGFQAQPISESSSSQSQWLLNQYPGSGFQVASEHGCLTLRWKERPVFFASAWSC